MWPIKSETSDKEQERLNRANEAVRAVHPNLRLRVSKRARRMALRLNPAEQVVYLTIPTRASIQRALEFARENRAWVEQRLADLPAPIPFVHGTVLPLLGRDVVLRIEHEPTRRVTDIELTDDALIVRTNKPDPQNRIKRFLRQLAEESITPIATEKASAIHLDNKIKTITVRDTHSRWGSCSEDGNLSFSWRLIFAPPLAMDYVIGHEIAHLQFMDHSQRFWKLCAEMSQDFDFGHGWMQKNGTMLMSYGQDVFTDKNAE